MPKRTTTLQTVVAFVRQHFAGPGITVTESKMLHDRANDVEREVDVVVEGLFDGDEVVTSLEVVEHTRRASITWVEQQISKHRTLPTRHLILVSASGFTRGAIARASKEGGWVQCATPNLVEVDGQPAIKSLFLARLELKPTKCVMVVQPLDEQPLRVTVSTDQNVYGPAGEFIGTALELVTDALHLDWIFRHFLDMARTSDRRGEIGGFEVVLPIANLGYQLLHIDSGEYHPISTIFLAGEAGFTQDEMTFRLAELGGRQFGVGEGTLMGREAVWVGSTVNVEGVTKISWRTKGSKPEPPVELPLGSREPVRFEGLKDLEAPAEWADTTDEEATGDDTLLASRTYTPPVYRGNADGDATTRSQGVWRGV